MTTYTDVKNAIQSQHELMKKMASTLSEEEFQQLLNNSNGYVQAKMEESKRKKEETKKEQKDKLDNIKQKKNEEASKRKSINNEINEKAAQIRKESNAKLAKIKAEEKQKLEEYQTKQKTAFVDVHTNIKLQAEDEFRKIVEEESKIEKSKQEVVDVYKQKLESEDLQRRQEVLAATLQLKADLSHETELKLSGLRAKQRIREHEAKKEFLLQRDRELKRIESENRFLSERLKYDSLLNFFSGEEGSKRLTNIAGLVVTSFAAFFGFKAAYPVLQRGLHSYLFKPTLVSRAVRQTWWSRLFKKPFSSTSSVKVILVPHLQERMDGIIHATKNISQRGGIFNNLLLYGQPGTGKTLFSSKLAELSGMDFAVMSGPSFDQFEPDEAITEIKNLFSWANRSPRGLLLFVDEADSFLEDRSTLHPARISVLNEWLNQTGTESRKFMCIYETNRPEILDPAVQSRITQAIEFPLPSQREIFEMLAQYTEIYLIKDSVGLKERGFFTYLRRRLSPSFEQIDANVLSGLLEKISVDLAHEKFVGRDVTNFVIALAQAAYATPDLKLTPDLVDAVLKQQIEKKHADVSYLASRRERIKDYNLRMQTR